MPKSLLIVQKATALKTMLSLVRKIQITIKTGPFHNSGIAKVREII